MIPKRNKIFLILFLFLALINASCKKKQKDYYYNATVVDFYSNDVIPGVSFSFKVSNSVLIFYSSNSPNSYSGTSDANGKIAFKIKEEDKDGYFMPNSEKPDFDSLNVNWWYRSYSIYDFTDPKSGKIVLYPAAHIIFRHPILDLGNSNWDVINISVNGQKVSVDLDNTKSKSCAVLPSREHNIEIEYIKFGVSTFKTIKRYIPAAYYKSPTGSDVYHVDAFEIELPE